MIKICVTLKLNEGHNQYNSPYRSHRTKGDDDDFNSVRGINCEGHTHARTHVRTHTHTHTKYTQTHVQNTQSEFLVKLGTYGFLYF